MDKFETMYGLQEGLLRRLEPDWLEWNEPMRVRFIKDLVVHMNVEVAEMLQELPYVKPWKDYTTLGPERIEEMFAVARNEAVDVLHFFLEILIVLGFTPQEVYSMYMKKMSVNHKRQNEGYQHG